MVTRKDWNNPQAEEVILNLRKVKTQIAVLDEGKLRSDQVIIIARRLGVGEQDVIDMNGRLFGDVSLNAPIR